MPRLATTGHVIREPQWPAGGFVSRPMGERHYEVQAYTGYPVSTVPKGRWNRGVVTRFQAQEFRPNVGPLYMNDPTDPTRFVLAVSSNRRKGLVSGGRRK